MVLKRTSCDAADAFNARHDDASRETPQTSAFYAEAEASGEKLHSHGSDVASRCEPCMQTLSKEGRRASTQL